MDHNESRLADAEVVYWWQKWTMEGPWQGHYFDDKVAMTLLGYPPDNLSDMERAYNDHVKSISRPINDFYWDLGDGPYRLERWQRWLKRLRKDLRIFLNEIKLVGENPFVKNHAIAPLWGGTWLELEGCGTPISVIPSAELKECNRFISVTPSHPQLDNEE